ncbi:palmitoyltransferase ZDHHC3-like isoform X1 [Rhineura floridana]|uniref:palmitoyltransferase ZDHHC3-like isoform X1 n=1 Tax=Rhineura floridana TaxID=261503 RepID=UPI002AC86CD1|nr:palmitoyltransferase ZDHHC3-like isoform X1 [Rhineura floridana]
MGAAVAAGGRCRCWCCGKGRCRADPCGVLCLLLTYISVVYADYVILEHVLLQPGFRGSLWCPFHAVVFNFIVVMLLACHTRAVFADPGMVPLPDTAIDFSDLRSSSGSASHKNSRNNEDWTVCNHCETYRPPRAHHCRVCHRCVRRMDHHCPWINNCVGELNQKYFIQFLFYTGLASLYAMGLVLTTWLWPADKSSSGKAEGTEGGVPGNRIQIAHRIVLLVESILFGLFVTVIFYDQLVSIITDETPIEQLRNRLLKEARREVLHTRKPKIALLREVFGRGLVICWLFPCNCSSPSASRPSYSYLPNYEV